MGINTHIPQFRDSSISTMLRTNPDEIFEFSVENDSIPDLDSFLNIDPIPFNDGVDSQTVVPVTSGDTIHDNLAVNPVDTQAQHSNLDSNYFIDWGNFPSLEGDTSCLDTAIIDSIVGVSDSIEVVPDSTFTNDNILVAREYASNDWMTVAIIIVLFVAGWIRLNFSKQMSQILKGFFSFRQSARLYNEQNSIQQNVSTAMDVLFFLVTSLFISQLLSFYEYSFLELNHIYSSLVVSFIYVGLVYLKVFLYKSIAFLFDNSFVTSEYIHNSFVVKKVLTLAILPFLVAIPFVSETIAFWLIMIGIILYSLFYSLQLLRGIQIIILKNQSIIYSFLYLCALEIVPILIIFKIVSLFL